MPHSCFTFYNNLTLTKIRVHENIIIIGDLSETYRRPIGDPSETYRRPIRDPSETDMPHRRPTCLIGDPSETDMPYRRPIGDRHASSETDMPHRRPTCLIGDRQAAAKTHKKYITLPDLEFLALFYTINSY